MDSKIKEAIEIFNQGGIVIFPTDTAFGIGCRLDKEDSIKRLLSIRKRPVFMPTPVLVDGLDMAREYLQDVPQDVIDKLINKYWPGALTIVLPCKKEKLYPLVRGNGETIGVRMPNNTTLLGIIKELGVPILGSSANFHGKNTPYEYKDLDPELIKLVDFVLEGECLVKKPSTVVDCSKIPWEVLRIGAIDINI